MGIYIKDLELPKHGAIIMLIDSTCAAREAGSFEVINDKLIYFPTFVNYAAVEVATPHGRLGDLTELLMSIPMTEVDGKMEVATTASDLVKKIAYAPTIIKEEK